MNEIGHPKDTVGSDQKPPFWPPPPPAWKPATGSTGSVSRRVIQGTLIGIGVVVALMAVAVVVTLISLVRWLDHQEPGPPHSRPIPVGRAADIGAGWKLEVLRVAPNVERQARAAETTHRVASSSRYFVVKLEVTYTGRGKGDVSNLLGYGVDATGAHNATYTSDNSCGNYVPRPALGRAHKLLSGQTTRGYRCYRIAADDASTLMLYTGWSETGKLFVGPVQLRHVLFALH
jgi:hypothetical protein